MNRRHHPFDRAERLKLKEEHETKKTKAGHLKRRLKENLKAQEAEDELREYS